MLTLHSAEPLADELDDDETGDGVEVDDGDVALEVDTGARVADGDDDGSEIEIDYGDGTTEFVRAGPVGADAEDQDEGIEIDYGDGTVEVVYGAREEQDDEDNLDGLIDYGDLQVCVSDRKATPRAARRGHLP